MAYPDAVLRRGEHVLAHRRPHWRMLVVPALVAPVAVVLAAFLAGVAGAIPAGSTRLAVRLALVLLAVVVVGWLAVLPLVRWRFTHLVVTDRRLLVREGVVARESVDVPAATITGVRTSRTSLDHVLGAGTLVVATVGRREPWEFLGVGDVERLAALVEDVADERGGLALAEPDEAEPGDEDWGAWPPGADADDPEAPGDERGPDDAGLRRDRGRWRRRAARTSR